MPRLLNQKETDEIIKLQYDDITRTKIIDLFSNKYDKKTKKIVRKFNTNDKLMLPANTCCNNKRMETTVGRYIYNKKIIEKDFSDVIGFFNEPITKKNLGKIENMISEALLNDVITIKQMKDYLRNTQWMFSFTHILTPGFTSSTYKPDKVVVKRKKQLMKEYKTELENGNAIVGSSMEKELLDLAREKNINDIGFDIFNSGAMGSFDNNYKSLNIMKGPMLDTQTGKYIVSTNNYGDGIAKEEMPIFANSLVNGAYSKGVGTQIGGYMTKKNLASFQSLQLDEAGTDCGTTEYIDIKIDSFNRKLMLYSYIVENNKLILLDQTNIDKYVGRVVKMRSPMCCKSDKICNKCAGELFYKLGIKNVGLTITKESSSLLNKFMKKFHDTTIKTSTLDMDDLIL